MYFLKEKLNVKQKYEKRGLWFSTFSNVLFVIFEFGISYLSNSRAVLIDGMFDGGETILLAFSLWLTKYLYKPINEKRPIGYSNLEPFYMILKGLLFFLIAVMMVFSSVRSFFTGGYSVNLDYVFYFEMCAGGYGLFAYLLLRRINRKARSQILELEIKEWMFDIVGSLGTGLGFFIALLAQFTPFRASAHYFDQILTIAMAIYILPTPFKAMKSGFQELFFLSPGEKILQQVKTIAVRVAAEHGIDEAQLDFDVVKTGRRLWISVYIEPRGDYIDVQLLRQLHTELERQYVSLADIIDVDMIPDI